MNKKLWSKSKPAKDFPKNWLVVPVLDVKDLKLELKKLRVKYNSALSCLPVPIDSEVEERIREEERTKFEKSLSFANTVIEKINKKFKKRIKENIDDLDQVKKDFVKNDNETVWVGETETLFDRLSFLQKKYGKQIKEVQKE